MRLSLLLILFVLIAICAAKSSKSKSPKPTKTIKASETKKHKDQEQNKEAGKTHKTFSKQHDSKKKSKAHKTADKTSKIISDKAVNKTSGEKITNNTGNVDKKGNNTKGKCCLGFRIFIGFVDNQVNSVVVTGKQTILKINSRRSITRKILFHALRKGRELSRCLVTTHSNL